jgi:hypothetical protein
MSNMGGLDRFFRALAGVLALLLGFFWLGGVGQIVAYGVAAVLLVTAAVRFCPLYRVLGLHTGGSGDKITGTSVAKPLIAATLLVAAAAAGAYASNMFTRKFFLEDFNGMNNFYKQTLFLTGKGERAKAVENYDQLLKSYAGFRARYAGWQPYALRGDAQLQADLAKVSGILSGVNDLVRTGDLQQAHLSLEGVRPVFQDLFKRNGFSMLSVALVDFHDAMELMLEAGNGKDAAKLVALYPQVSAKLKAVEVEANDGEIQAIRKNLDGLLKAAEAGGKDDLPAKAEQLKSSFVKVYLQRG